MQNLDSAEIARLAPYVLGLDAQVAIARQNAAAAAPAEGAAVGALEPELNPAEAVADNN